jgi:hypothetical protein
MTLRTPAIRRDRPTVRGSPALRARSTSAGLAPAELSAKNHRCDAKDHARPRKYLEQNSFSTRGVQVRLDICFSKAASFLGSADAVAHRGAAMHSQIKICKNFFSVIEYIGLFLVDRNEVLIFIFGLHINVRFKRNDCSLNRFAEPAEAHLSRRATLLAAPELQGKAA